MRAVRLLVAAAVAALAVAGSAHAGSLDDGAGAAVDTGADYNGGKALPFAPGQGEQGPGRARAVHGHGAGGGDRRPNSIWFATDDVLGTST